LKVSDIGIYIAGLAAALGLMTLLWLVSLALRNSSIVDIFWGGARVWITLFIIPDLGTEAHYILMHLGQMCSIFIPCQRQGRLACDTTGSARRGGGEAISVFVLQGV
jgi:hypothetical protein